MTFPSPGSIAFLGFNADGPDSFAFLVIDAIPAGSTIRFRDDPWNGSGFPTATESRITWTTTAAVPAGTVVQISNVFGLTTGTQPLTANVGSATITTSNPFGRGFSALSEVLYAYVGPDADTPTTFLAAIANNGFSAANGLLPSSLTVGTTAIDLGTGATSGSPDVAAYDARVNPVDFGSNRALALATINDRTRWVTQNGVGDQSNDGTAPEGDFLGDVESPLNGVTFVICYLSGTRIATPAGEVAVEALRPGDLVLLADGRTLPVRWLGRQQVLSAVARRSHALPVRIQAEALGEGLPKRDLLVSPGHAIGFGDALVNAGALVNGTTIREETAMPPRFTYWHVELAEHALLLAEGVPAESFLDTVEPIRFDNGAERPDFPPVEEMDLPRASSRRQVPRRIRALVAERAAALAATDAAAA